MLQDDISPHVLRRMRQNPYLMVIVNFINKHNDVTIRDGGSIVCHIARWMASMRTYRSLEKITICMEITMRPPTTEVMCYLKKLPASEKKDGMMIVTIVYPDDDAKNESIAVPMNFDAVFKSLLWDIRETMVSPVLFAKKEDDGETICAFRMLNPGDKSPDEHDPKDCLALFCRECEACGGPVPCNSDRMCCLWCQADAVATQLCEDEEKEGQRRREPRKKNKKKKKNKNKKNKDDDYYEEVIVFVPQRREFTRKDFTMPEASPELEALGFVF